MTTVFGADAGGVVRLVGNDASAMPTLWNGMSIKIYVLTPDQEAAYNALPSDRGGTTFDGAKCAALPHPPPPPKPPLDPKITTMLNDPAVAQSVKDAISALARQ